MSPSKAARTTALDKFRNLRPTNPRTPVRVNFDGGRGSVMVPPGSKWAEDPTGQMLYIQFSNGALHAYVARGGVREVPIPPSVDLELIAKYFPN